MSKNEIKKTSNPFKLLLVIPIQLLIDIIVVAATFYMETMPRPEIHGHATGLMTLFMAIIMVAITAIVIVIVLLAIIIRLIIIDSKQSKSSSHQ